MPEEPACIFSHRSIRPDREDIIGEVVFSEHWRRLASRPGPCSDDDEGSLPSMLGGWLDGLTQRDATVAASVIQWLGTNAGSSFLHLAGRMTETHKPFRHFPNPYHLAWCAENARNGMINGRRRALESIMAPLVTDETFTSRNLLGDTEVSLSLRDYEVAEALAMWLGSPDGLSFVAGCLAEVEIRRDARRHYLRASRAALTAA